MTVFATPILDDFNRANEAPLSAVAGWADSYMYAGTGSAGSLRVTANQLQSNGMSAASQYWGTAFAADQEVYLTLGRVTSGSPNTMSMAARIINPTLPNALCYRCDLLFNGAGFFSSANASIINPTSGLVILNMGSVGSGPVPSTAGGDAMGLRVYTLPDGGTRFEMWFRISGVWILKIAYNDLYKIGPQGNGYIGVSINTAWPGTPFFDDFGGGSITIPNNPMNDAYPTYNSTLNNTLSRRAWPEPKTAGTVTKPRPVAGQIWPRRK